MARDNGPDRVSKNDIQRLVRRSHGVWNYVLLAGC